MSTEVIEALEVPLAINLVAVSVGALAGAIRAGEDERTDLVGLITLAAVMGFGGGIIRDVLVGNLPPAVLRDPAYLIAVMIAAALGALFLVYLKRLGKVIWVLDALAIGLFACVGANAALLAGLSLLPAVLIGTVASVGGLMLADVLQGRPSEILYVGPPNAAAGMAGAFTYGLVYAEDRQLLALVVAVAVTFLVRLTGPVLHLEVPQPRRKAYELEQRLRAKALARAQAKKRKPAADLAEGADPPV
jgi:uncharacterized membrane protein YeiH